MKNMIKQALAVLCAVVGLSCNLKAYLLSLSDPNALPVAQNVYAYLATRSTATTHKMIEGQHLGG